MNIQTTFFSSFDHTDPFPMRSWYVQHMAQIAGIDEAGRGPLAGPVVAAAVVLPSDAPCIALLNDSKKLTEKKRNLLFDKIHNEALSVGVSVVNPDRIESLNILGATLWGMKEAFEKAQLKAAKPILGALVDGNQRVNLAPDIVQHTLVKGDAKCPSIMAASIIAKVTRDRMMEAAAIKYPEYGFEKHKGYGTKVHMEALRQNGPCPIHRRSFAPVKKYASTKKKAATHKIQTAVRLGEQGERSAEVYLRKNDFKVITCRYRALKGEIDIIGFDDDILCFVEVKSQSKTGLIPPHHQVNARKRKHLIRAARAFLNERFPGQKPNCRFDVVAIEDAVTSPQIKWHRAAFNEKGI